MSTYYILEGKEVKAVDLLIWAKWFETEDRVVAKTSIGKAEVSTVFLGMDHNWANGPPLLFETMVFGLEDDYQERYSTWDEAEVGHAKTVAWVEKVSQ